MMVLMLGKDFSISVAFGMAFLALTVYFVTRCVYDLFFHPLRKFPGKKIAAIGSFYEFYYDVIKDGTYIWEIEKMHRAYGPIVRINSHSLHIHDPEYYSTVYVGGGRRTNKDYPAVVGYTFLSSSLATLDHDLHRKRRAIISPYFSKGAISDLEPIINERLSTLCLRLKETMARGVTVDLTLAFSTLTADLITYYFYGSHPDYLSSKDFKFDLKDAITALANIYNLARFLPFLGPFAKSIPLPILRILSPQFSLIMLARKYNQERILKFFSSDDRETKSKSVIVSAFTEPRIPAEEKTMDRLLDEGETIIYAGIDTTTRTLGVAMFHLLSGDKRHLQKLRQELNSMSRPANQAWTVAELEALPFLRGVVQESLRLSNPLVVRLPRVAAEEALQYKQYTIPPGTPVSQSNYLIHHDASIFPNPKLFDPERWIKAAQEGRNLDNYMVSFTKGSRACVGMNLAYAELYLSIATIASSFDMEIFETTQQDMELYHTRAVGFPKVGSGAVKARITGILN